MEEDIQGHTKKAFQKWNEKGLTLWQRVKAVAIEIAIMVFAVTLSISFNNMSNKRQQNNDTKDFLLGLKADLTEDIKEMEADKKAYVKKTAAFQYFTKLKMKEPVSKDSLKKYGNTVFSMAELMPNNGRFEGFKSSGRIGNIDNKVLQNDIMDLYQENIPILLYITHDYVKMQKELSNYITENRKRITDTTTNFSSLTKDDKVRNRCVILAATEDIFERYDLCINKMKKIIVEIDKEYK
jgi:Family of unknown function (DUF6090)